jgi:hypothetical protein
MILSYDTTGKMFQAAAFRGRSGAGGGPDSEVGLTNLPVSWRTRHLPCPVASDSPRSILSRACCRPRRRLFLGRAATAVVTRISRITLVHRGNCLVIAGHPERLSRGARYYDSVSHHRVHRRRIADRQASSTPCGVRPSSVPPPAQPTRLASAGFSTAPSPSCQLGLHDRYHTEAAR